MSKALKRNYSIALMAPTDAVGLLIGKQGLNLKDIAQGSGAKLSFQAFSDIPAGCSNRGVVLAGSLDAVVKAQEIMLQKLKTRRPKGDSEDLPIDSGKYLIKWVISNRVCGLLIGRNGEGIKHINDVSGAWVKVGHEEETAPGASERLVYITGTPEQNSIAKQMVIERVGGRPYISSPQTSGEEVQNAENRIVSTCCEVQLLWRDFQGEIQDIATTMGVTIAASPLASIEMGLPQRDIIIGGASEEVRLLAVERVRSLLTTLRSLFPSASDETCVKLLIPVSCMDTFLESTHDDVLNMLRLEANVFISVIMDGKSPSISQNSRELIVAGSIGKMLLAVRTIIERLQAIDGVCRLPIQASSSPPSNAYSTMYPAVGVWSAPMYSPPTVSGSMRNNTWSHPASAGMYYYSPETFQQQLYQNYLNSVVYSNIGAYVATTRTPPPTQRRGGADEGSRYTPPIAPSISDMQHGPRAMHSMQQDLPYYTYASAAPTYMHPNRANDSTAYRAMLEANRAAYAMRKPSGTLPAGDVRLRNSGSAGVTYPLSANPHLGLHPASTAAQERAQDTFVTSPPPQQGVNPMVAANCGVLISPRVFPPPETSAPNNIQQNFAK